MRSTKDLTVRLALLLCVTTVSACAVQERTRPAFPPAADVKAVVDPKPQPSADIVTSAQASEDYNAAIEGWGDGIYAAGSRICRWLERAGMKLDFRCPDPVAPDPPQH
jgi:hypothetical protein